MKIGIAWSVTAAEAVHHPDVERLPTGQPCEGWMSSKNYKGPRDPTKGACKVSARWRYTAPNPGDFLAATSGVYCWKHLIYTGICGGNDEAYRTAEWLTTLRALS